MLGAVRIFEQEFAEWLGVPGAIAVGFGRAALRLCLESTECKGKAVLLPDFICAQVADAVRGAGAKIALYPVERDLSICMDSFQSALTPGIRVALVPHYFGRTTPNIAELAAACRERGVLLVEDCALAWGATLDGRPAGTFGDFSIFSCTKSGWCFGGGLLASRSSEFARGAQAARGRAFRAASRLLFSYGLLRHADFLANRPQWSTVAERAGRWLERMAGMREANFYDAGRCDAEMSSLSARRARRLLRWLVEDVRRRRELKQRLVQHLSDSPQALFWQNEDPGDVGAFLLLRSPAGRARHWVEDARRDGITLRLPWMAYQELPDEKSGSLEWLADHLVILEVHPKLSGQEMQRIANCVRRLATRG